MQISQKIKKEVLTPEMEFTASKSSGPGGQNVNKVNTKISLRFDIGQSALLTDEEKELLRKKLSTKLTTEGILLIEAQEKRSQLQNKEISIKKFYDLFEEAFRKKKKRIATKPSKSAVKKRLDNKKQHAEKKSNRKKLL